MSERRDIPGLWWIPSNPERKWIGKLAVAPNKSPRLRITIPEGHFAKVPELPELLHGCDQHGKPITLLHVGVGNKSMSGAMTRIKCSAGYALIGIAVSSPQELRAHTLFLRTQYLFDWIARTGFKNESTVQYESKIHHVLPDLLTFDVSPDLKLKIIASSHSQSVHRMRSVSENASIRFESLPGLSITECNELATAVRHLLHFAILRPVYTISLSCRVNGHGTDCGDNYFPHDIDIASGGLHEEAKSEPDSGRWLFQFADVEADFGAFFQRWLSFVREFDEAMGCYCTTVYHSLPDTVEHLCLTQALEAYHAIKHQSHKSRDFPEKIREIVEAHQKIFPNEFPDAGDFVATVHHNRNYYTHHNPKWKNEGRVVERGELFRLNLKLRLLFQACVLTELGIPSDRFRRLRRQLDVHLIEYI